MDQCACFLLLLLAFGYNKFANTQLPDDGDESCYCVKQFSCDKETKRILQNSLSTAVYWKYKKSGENCLNVGEVCCKAPLSGESNGPKPRKQTKYECGKAYIGKPGEVPSRLDWGFKVLGGGVTEIGEFPWMLAMYKEDIQHPEIQRNPLQIKQCGASLLTPKIALTAAHCIEKFADLAGPLMVRAGEWDTNAEGESPHQERTVSQVEIHPGFTKDPPQNDIAVLVLGDDFELNEHVNTICLPDLGVSYEGQRCVGVGWGLDGEDENAQQQPRLKKAKLPIVPVQQCQQAIREELERRGVGIAKSFVLHESFICAGGQADEDLCQGDGGGPLICRSHESPRRYVQVGITSWGLGCGREGIPGMYSSVDKLHSWIYDMIFKWDDLNVTDDAEDISDAA